jgi:hypothetical protein
MLFSIAYAADVATEVLTSPLAAPATIMVNTVGEAWNQLLIAVMVAIVPIVGAIGAYSVILIRTWLKAKISKIKNDELRAAADFAMQRLDHIVTNIVKEIQQTKPTQTEPITKEQAKALLGKAYNMVKAQVTTEIIDVVKTVVNDPNRYIVTKIEAAVGEQKMAKTTADCK